MKAAMGTLKFNSKIGQTFAATSAINSPDRIARSETGSFDQKLVDAAIFDYTSSGSFFGSSMHSFTLIRKVTASFPSMAR